MKTMAVDGLLGASGALVATAGQASQTITDTLSNASTVDVLTVAAVGVATPIVKDLIYKGLKWVFTRLYKLVFKNKQV